MKKFLCACIAAILSASVFAVTAEDVQPITVYTAKKIITMDPTNPEATAVAVRGNRIVSVGSMDDLKPWLEANPHTIDDRFKNKVIMPGLIDPHLHPLLAAIQFGAVWITPEAWSLHDELVPATNTPEQYMTRLKAAFEELKDDGKPMFITWGWQETDHGPITKAILDEISTDKPIMVWQRSTHDAVFNTAAIKYMGLTKEDVKDKSESEVNWDKAHFVEAGFFEVALPRITQYIMTPDFLRAGFSRNADYLTAGGVTTVADMATGQVHWDSELAIYQANNVDRNVPYRTVLVASAHLMALTNGGLDKSFELIDSAMSTPAESRQLVHGRRIKLFSDGAMFGQMMQVGEPGYIDGHHGEWLTPLEDLTAQSRKYWEAGYRIHVHANGDKGIQRVLDIFEELQMETPRGPNSLVIEHFGYADEAIARRIADLGATVSANPYYLTGLGDSYAKTGLGPERAQRITPVSSLVDKGVTVTLHSDFGMAPARPFYLAWSAMTRETLSGDVYAPPRGLTREEALKAVTVNAAYVLGLESEIGSIQSGKLADLAILEDDPTKVKVKKLKDIKVWGVMFEGEIRQAVSH